MAPAAYGRGVVGRVRPCARDLFFEAGLVVEVLQAKRDRAREVVHGCFELREGRAIVQMKNRAAVAAVHGPDIDDLRLHRSVRFGWSCPGVQRFVTHRRLIGRPDELAADDPRYIRHGGRDELEHLGDIRVDAYERSGGDEIVIDGGRGWGHRDDTYSFGA
ncbi:MAG: hypothetical protein ACOCU9_04290 [Spirochaetota bacterium]